MKGFAAFLTEGWARVGWVSPEGEEVSNGRDHTEIAAEVLQDRDADVNDLLDQGWVRFWVTEGEVSVQFDVRFRAAAKHALALIRQEVESGDLIYVDMQKNRRDVVPLGVSRAFHNVRQANQMIRQYTGIMEGIEGVITEESTMASIELYHGTSRQRANKIAANGFKCRAVKNTFQQFLTEGAPVVKQCNRCQTAPWTCRTCGARCCEHLCGFKTPDGKATCAKCQRRPWSPSKNTK